jgi:hypothetical protein
MRDLDLSVRAVSVDSDKMKH